MNTRKRMPGPGFLSSLRWGLRFRNDYIAPLKELFETYGDYVMFTGGPPVCAVFHPDAVEYVLRKNHKNYRKPLAMQEMKPVLGNGLLLSDGEEWKKHRQIIGPEFQSKKIDAFYPVMVKHLERLLHEWREAGAAFDVVPSISRMTYLIAGECFFGAAVEESAEVIRRGVELTSEIAVRRMSMPLLNLPLWLPLPKHQRARKAIAQMDAVVYGILDERARHPSGSEDMLSRLTRAAAESGLSRQQIRDEVMTMLLAGHETTANALSWTLYLLGKNPEAQNHLREEILSTVAGDAPTLQELRKLNYTRMVIDESMRLYPPAASIGRDSIGADEICGYPIPAGTSVNMAQWITHRHPEFWSEPERFLPERFADPAGHHPFAYFPFAAGPRECVGKNMAMVEAVALLAGMARHFEFELVRDNVRVRPLITIRPDPGVVMRLRPVRSPRPRPSGGAPVPRADRI